MLHRCCRADALPEEYIPEISKALEGVGLQWKDFKLVDNSCPPHPEVDSVDNFVGAVKDLNPQEEKPQESPVEIGQGDKFSYMESEKSAQTGSPADGDQTSALRSSLTNIAP